MLTRNSYVRDFLHGIAIFRMAFYYAPTYAKLPQEERRNFLVDLLDEVNNYSGPKKILLPYQIPTDDDAIICLRGFAAQIRGIWQSESVFSPGNVVNGASINNLDFSTFCGLVHSLCSSIGVNLIDEVHELAWTKGETQGQELSFVDLCASAIVGEIIPSTGDPLLYADGIRVSKHVRVFPIYRKNAYERTIPLGDRRSPPSGG